MDQDDKTVQYGANSSMPKPEPVDGDKTIARPIAQPAAQPAQAVNPPPPPQEEKKMSDFEPIPVTPEPVSPAGEPEKKKTWLIVLIVVLVLLCCCCLVVAGIGIAGSNEGWFEDFTAILPLLM